MPHGGSLVIGVSTLFLLHLPPPLTPSISLHPSPPPSPSTPHPLHLPPPLTPSISLHPSPPPSPSTPHPLHSLQSIPYSTLLKELDIHTSNVRELEDLIIEAIYAGIIQAKLDQKNAQVHVHGVYHNHTYICTCL